MKFKKNISLITIFFSFFLYFVPEAWAEEKTCVEGKIERYQYDSLGNITVHVNGKHLYTQKDHLQPLLFISFLLGKPVEIITNETCYNGGSFSKVYFKK